jgi:hypothetical protein
MEWIMTEPVTRICQPYSERFLGVLLTVLQAEPKYVGVTLDRAGIMSVETPVDIQVEETADSVESNLSEPPTRRVFIHDDMVAEASSRSARSDSSVTLAADDVAYGQYSVPSSTPRASGHLPFTPR